MLREATVKNGKLKGLPSADPRVTVYKGIPSQSLRRVNFVGESLSLAKTGKA